MIYANKTYRIRFEKLTGKEPEWIHRAIEELWRAYTKKWKVYYSSSTAGDFEREKDHYYNPEQEEVPIWSKQVLKPLTERIIKSLL